MPPALSRPAAGGALALVLCATLAWLAQFHHFREFGLYEDDYWFISQAMGQDSGYLATRLTTAFTALPQGRPLGFFLPDLASFVGDKLGGLSAIYLLGFAVVSLNTFLCFRLLRTRVPLAAASVGAAVFCLFPADTTKILLTHDFQLQPSLTFALLAALAYGAGRRWLSYVIGAGALLSYESGYLALFALPLFADRWDRLLLRRLLVHWAGLLAVLIVVVVARYAAGEGRATASVGGASAILPSLIGSLVLGPARSVAAMFYGPLKAIPVWDLETLILVVLAFAAFGALLLLTTRVAPHALGTSASGAMSAAAPTARCMTRDGSQGGELHRPIASRVEGPGSASGHVAESQGPACGRLADGPWRVAAAGLAMLILGYGLAFTHFPPNAVVGRGTSVHLGATLGMAVLAAAIGWFLLRLRPTLAAGLVAGYLALAVGYYVTIERDFMASWQIQRGFWQQVAACCSDAGQGTVLLYELNPADEPTFIFTNSWADPLILSQTYDYPRAWANPPRLFSLTQWVDRVEPEGDHLRWWVPGASWDEHWETLPQANVIVLRRGLDGTLKRVSGTIDTPAGPLQLKPNAPPHSWPPAQLYEPLLGHA